MPVERPLELVMCGIVGVYEHGTQRPVPSALLLAMLQTIRHRGPDDENIYVDDDLALGMRRLSIIDIAGGRQPMPNEDGTLWCVCNGEIYNFKALRDELQSKGHRFATASDTEVVVHAYEQWGTAFLERLRGMFGLAVWDSLQRKLVVARDRLGIKPIYYAADGERLIFASEIKSILRHPTILATLDPDSLNYFLSLKYVPAPLTMFQNIRALPPGHMLQCGRDGIALSCYWDLPQHEADSHRQTEAEYADELEALLKESIGLHLVSDVPFGAFLSGGLDSSTVVALMTQVLDRPVKTFSVGFKGESQAFSELPYARQVASSCGTDHHELYIDARDFIEQVEKIVWHLDQPIADDACLANYMVAELAARQVKMVLTGEGGDELFAGYARYAGERLAPIFRTIPAPLKARALKWTKGFPGLRRPKLALNALSQHEEPERFVEWFSLFDQTSKHQLLSAEFQDSVSGANVRDVFAAQLSRTNWPDAVSRMLYVDTKLWLADDLLARGDKMSMAASIEARVPLLDHKLVEFAARLPIDLKLKGFQRKYLLRKLSAKWLPSEIIQRRKKGFPIPISLWFRREAREFLHDYLSPESVRRRGLFDPEYTAKLLSEHDHGFADHGSRLWALLSVEVWHQLFVERDARIVP